MSDSAQERELFDARGKLRVAGNVQTRTENAARSVFPFRAIVISGV